MEDKKIVENDDLLLQQFFAEAAQQEIEDNGFTERVMQQLPARQVYSIKWFNRLWTLFCIAVAGVLFFMFGGWQVVTGLFFASLRVTLSWLEVQMVTATTTEIPVNLWAILLLVVMVLVYLPYQTVRKLSATL